MCDTVKQSEVVVFHDYKSILLFRLKLNQSLSLLLNNSIALFNLAWILLVFPRRRAFPGAARICKHPDIREIQWRFARSDLQNFLARGRTEKRKNGSAGSRIKKELRLSPKLSLPCLQLAISKTKKNTRNANFSLVNRP